MRFFRQALIGLTLLTLSLGILAYAGSLIKNALTERFAQEAQAPQPRERTFAVNVVTAEPKSITPQLEAFGEIKSRRTLDLRLAIGGQVTELSKNFVDGGQVKLGEKLVELNDADAQSSYLKAKADIMDAQAEVEDAGRALSLSQDELEAARLLVHDRGPGRRSSSGLIGHRRPPRPRAHGGEDRRPETHRRCQ